MSWFDQEQEVRDAAMKASRATEARIEAMSRENEIRRPPGLRAPLYEAGHTLEAAHAQMDAIMGKMFGENSAKPPRPMEADVGAVMPIAATAEHVMRLAQDLNRRLADLSERL